MHDKDLAAGYDGVFLDDAVEKKYPNAPKEFLHQWFFPQKPLTTVVETGERRHYHLHESQLQGALYHAVRKAKIPKKVTAHTFRHSFGSGVRVPSRSNDDAFHLFNVHVGLYLIRI